MNQKGFILPTVLAFMILGSLIIGGLLYMLNANLRAQGREMDRTKAYFTASAAVEAVLAELAQGKDQGFPSSISLNGITANISVISADSPDFPPRLLYRYLDPGVGTLTPGEEWEVVIQKAQPYSNLYVRWAWDRPKLSGKLSIWGWDQNEKDWNQTTMQSLKGESPLFLALRLTDGKKYKICFENIDAEGKILDSSDYSSNGGSDATWILAKARGKAYLITAEASGIKVKAYVRQIPGPQPVPQIVVVESWLAK